MLGHGRGRKTCESELVTKSESKFGPYGRGGKICRIELCHKSELQIGPTPRGEDM